MGSSSLSLSWGIKSHSKTIWQRFNYPALKCTWSYPYSTGQFGDLSEIVKNINDHDVLPEEVLSDSVYRYCCEDDTFCRVAGNNEEWHILRSSREQRRMTYFKKQPKTQKMEALNGRKGMIKLGKHLKVLCWIKIRVNTGGCQTGIRHRLATVSMPSATDHLPL